MKPRQLVHAGLVLVLCFAFLPHGAFAQMELLTGQSTEAKADDEKKTDETPPPEEVPEGEGPKSPRELVRTFFGDMQRYVDDDDKEALASAGQLFDLSDVPAADAKAIGESAARDLLNFLDRSTVELNPNRVYAPRDKNETSVSVSYRPDGKTETADIAMVQGADKVWRFSIETRKQAFDLFQQVRHLAPLHGIGGVSDATTWLRDKMPDWATKTAFLLAHWQWLGLLTLIFLGYLAGAIARWLIVGLSTWVARRRNVQLEQEGGGHARPFGISAMAAVWFIGLKYLVLPDQAYLIMITVARIAMMIGATWAACSVVDYVTELLEAAAKRTHTRIDDVLVPLVRRALKTFVLVIGFLWIAYNLDWNIGAMLAGLGIGGIAIALASKDTVENFFGAVQILIDRPFDVGDWIVMGDVEGTVEQVGFRSTRVRTFYNSLITLPNALLIRSTVDNIGARRYRRIKETLGVTYDTPPDKLEAFIEGIRELIRRHPYTRKDFYHVYFTGYGDSSLSILLYLFLRTPDWATELREKQRFLLDILRLANALGVDFAFPTRTLHMMKEADMPAHDAFGSVSDAQAEGRKRAKAIVDEFTGSKVPPPVDILGSAHGEEARGS